MSLIADLRQLDPKDIGRWPTHFRVLAVVVIFLLLTAIFVFLLPVSNQMPDLDRAKAQETQLLQTFDERQMKAANFESYKSQLADMQRSFGAMLRQLPGKTEVPSLLVDISQTGLAAGLQERLFQPAPENRKDFYAELPIRIRLTGSYHQFGSFVSGIASLPRIVTLHDISIVQEGKDLTGDHLTLDVTAKTYRYLDDAEMAPGEHHPTTPTNGGKP
jgi:type IV pilus assembly protein PilO